MEKRFKTGLVLGKFMPPHKGHLYLIDTAIEQCEKVYIFACSIKNESIDGKIRYESLRYEYSHNPNVYVLEITDENPQYPHECESLDEFYSYWINTVYNNINKLDVVFTSEEYGKEFAKYLKVQHIDVDIPRIKYPISGTKIRSNYKENLDYISKSIRRDFIKKIVFVGPESSGKSSMSELIAKHYNVRNIPEYGRKYVEDKDLNLKTKQELTLLDISHIAAGQIQIEDELSETEKMLICDTDLIITQIWSEIYFKTCPKWIVDESYNRKYDLYLLLDIDFDWVDDGTREFPELRKWHFNRIEQELIKRNLRYVKISGTVDQRLEKCIKEIEKINLYYS